MNESTEPSAWVTRYAHLILDQKTGRGAASAPVLDVASGMGRHARFFLGHGHPVTAIDRDVSRLSDLANDNNLTVIEADLEKPGQGWPIKEDRFAGVIVTNYLYRPLIPSIMRAVAENGILLYETYADGNEAYGGPSDPNFLLREGELLNLMRSGLTIVAYESGKITSPKEAVVQRICALRGKEPVLLSKNEVPADPS